MANQVTLTFLGETKDLERAADRVRSKVADIEDKVDSSSSRMRNAFDGVGTRVSSLAGTIATAGLALGGMAVGGAFLLGRELLSTADSASDLNEAMSKSDTVFGDSAAAIRSFADHAAENFGLSESAALSAAGGFGNMFDQLGIGESQSAALSQQIVALAGDFSSFHNADITDVLEAQSAAFRGEYDSLQQFVPLINAATVEQKALEMTGKAATDELTAQDKALATHALMLEGAGDAMGDFQRTADGAANSERIAQARMEDMRAEIGQKMIPVTQKLTEIKLALAGVLADNLGPAIDAVTGWFSDNEDTLRAVGNTIVDDVLPAIWDIISAVGTSLYDAVVWLGDQEDTWNAIGDAINDYVVPAFETITSAITTLLDNEAALTIFAGVIGGLLVAAFIAWAVSAASAAIATLAATWPILLAAAAIGALAAGLWYAYENWGWFQSAVDLFVAGSAGLWDSLQISIGWIVSVGQAVWDAGLAIAQFNQDVADAFSAVYSTISRYVGLAIGVISAGWNWIKSNTIETYNSIRSFISSIWGGITQHIRTQINTITGIFNAAKTVFSAIWSAIGGAITAPIRAALNGIRSAWNSTIGGRGISIPSVLGFGGASFTIPRLAEGGIALPRPGGHLVNVAEAGQAEAIVPLDRLGSMTGGSEPTVIEIHSGGSRLDDLLVEVLREAVSVRGGDVQVVLGQ